jgi:ABC-2 type transport system ATP-binding protein
MTERPHQYWIRSDNNRTLAAVIIAATSAAGVELVSANGRSASGRVHPTTGIRTHETALHVQASDVSQFVRTLPRLAAEHGIRLYEVSPADESLESVFSYLVA